MNISQMNISPKNTMSFLNLFGVIKDLTNEATIEFDIDEIKIFSTDTTFRVHISKDKLIDYVCLVNSVSIVNTQEMYDSIKNKIKVKNSVTGEYYMNFIPLSSCYKERVEPIIHLGENKKQEKIKESYEIISKWQYRIKAKVLCDSLVFINKDSDFMKIKCSSKTVSFIHKNGIIKPESTIVLPNNKFKAYINIHNLIHCCNFYCNDVHMNHVLYGNDERVLIVSYNLLDIGIFTLYV